MISFFYCRHVSFIYFTCIGRVDVAYGFSNKRRVNEPNLSSAIRGLIEFILKQENQKLAAALIDRKFIDELEMNSTRLLAIS